MIDERFHCPKCDGSTWSLYDTTPDGQQTRICTGAKLVLAKDLLDQHGVVYRPETCSFKWPECDDWKYRRVTIGADRADDMIHAAVQRAMKANRLGVVIDPAALRAEHKRTEQSEPIRPAWDQTATLHDLVVVDRGELEGVREAYEYARHCADICDSSAVGSGNRTDRTRAQSNLLGLIVRLLNRPAVVPGDA